MNKWKYAGKMDGLACRNLWIKPFLISEILEIPSLLRCISNGGISNRSINLNCWRKGGVYKPSTRLAVESVAAVVIAQTHNLTAKAKASNILTKCSNYHFAGMTHSHIFHNATLIVSHSTYWWQHHNQSPTIEMVSYNIKSRLVQMHTCARIHVWVCSVLLISSELANKRENIDDYKNAWPLIFQSGYGLFDYYEAGKICHC